MEASKEYLVLIEKVTKELKKKGLTQADVGKELDIFPTTINSAFRKKSEKTMLKIAQYLVDHHNVPEYYLFPDRKVWQEAFVDEVSKLSDKIGIQEAEIKRLRHNVDLIMTVSQKSLEKMNTLLDAIDRFIDKD